MRIWTVLVLGFFFAGNSDANPGTAKAPSGLLCELLSHPEKTVITNRQPGFSWIVNSVSANDHQTAYQIIVAGSPENLEKGSDLLWDTGRRESGQSSNVKYEGKPLVSHASYWWKVRTWNKDGEASPWSDLQRFNTGDLEYVRKWPGESRWVQLKRPDMESVWTFENRHPIEYHSVNPVRVVRGGFSTFFDFGRAAFAVPKIEYSYNPAATQNDSDTLWILLGEKAVGDSIDQMPGGGVIFRKFPFIPEPGTNTGKLELPRFVPRYPHSQSMPAHMPEIIPFRYVEVVGENSRLQVKNITQEALYYHFDEGNSRFSCSDPRLNDIYNLCRYSVKVNTFNGDYAASQRERMMYEADCYIHQMSHYAVDREFAIARYSLENMIFHATWPTEWIFHILLMAHADYLHTGNTGIIEKYFDELDKKLMTGLAGENWLVSTRTGKQTAELLRSIHFNGKELRDIVDWPHGGMGLVETNGETDSYDFREYNTVVNAFHYRALVLMSEMAAAIGKDEASEGYRKRAERVKDHFKEAFFDRLKGIFTDGMGSAHSSLHANMFPLAFGLVDEADKPAVLAFILSKGIACGVYGANYLMEALFNEKEAEYAFGLLTSDSDRSWLNMIRVGSTMTTEAWDNKYKSNNGWSHAWSASPAHIIPRKIMGIEPLTPGYGVIRIAPQPVSLTHASCLLPTIKGPVKADFQQEPGKSFELNFEIPANTRAKVVIPVAFSGGSVIFNGKITVPEREGDEHFLNAGSGHNTIKIWMP